MRVIGKVIVFVCFLAGISAAGSNVPWIRYYPLSTRGQMPVAADATGNIYIATPLSAMSKLDKVNSNGEVLFSVPLTMDVWGIAVDAGGKIYLAGNNSACFGGSFDPWLSCGDAQVQVLDSTGQRQFVYGLGGRRGENAFRVAVDASGFIYVAGVTASPDFPTKNAAQQANPMLTAVGCPIVGQCQSDAFVAKIDPVHNALVYSTFLGGSDGDGALDIAVDPEGNAVVIGYTYSSDFPLLHAEAQSGTGFLARISPSGQLLQSTYLSSTLIGSGVAADATGNMFVLGYEYPGTDSFVRKLNPSGGEIFNVRVGSDFATSMGGGNGTAGLVLAVDASGNVFVGGRTSAVDFPVLNGVQTQLSGSYSGFVSGYSPTGELILSTYFGGDSLNGVRGLAVDGSGTLYVSGEAGTNFPIFDGSSPVELNAADKTFFAKIERSGGPSLVAEPARVDFGGQAPGTAAALKTVVVSNRGTVPVDGITVSLATSPSSNANGFTLTDNCGISLPPAGSCELDIAFAPPLIGPYIAEVMLTGSFGQTRAGLIGRGILAGAPLMALSEQVYPPPAHAMPGRSTAAGSIKITNLGTAPLQLTNIHMPASFDAANLCPASIASLQTCRIDVTFRPVSPGEIIETMTVTSNDGRPPVDVQLHGVAADFSVSTSSSASVQAGQSATVSVTVQSQIARVNAPVTLTCSNLPPQSSCTFAATQLVPGTGTASTQLTIATTKPTTQAVRHDQRSSLWFAMWLPALGLVFAAGHIRRRWLLLAILLLGAWVGCGGGHETSLPPSSPPPTPPAPSPTGTPAGTYVVTVSGTSGILTRESKLTLTVN